MESAEVERDLADLDVSCGPCGGESNPIERRFNRNTYGVEGREARGNAQAGPNPNPLSRPVVVVVVIVL